MNIKHIGRILVCLLLVCCLIVNISPIKAEASATAAVVTAAAYVAANAEIIAGSILISLGVMQGLASDDFQQTVSDCVAHLDSLGTWVQDGTMQLLRTVDEAGTATYYAAIDMMEAVRSWLFDDTIVSDSSARWGTSHQITFGSDSMSFSSTENLGVIYLYGTYSGRTVHLIRLIVPSYYTEVTFVSPAGSTVMLRTTSYDYNSTGSYYYYDYSSYIWATSDAVKSVTGCNSIVNKTVFASSDELDAYFDSLPLLDTIFSTPYDLTLGVMHTGAIDGETYDDAYADYYRKQLQVYETGGSGDSGDDGNDPNWKKYLPLGLAVTMAGTMALDQVTEWEANTPAEFADQTTTSQEFEILSQPEVDIGTAIEIQPATGDDAGADSGSEGDTDSTTATDPGGATGVTTPEDPDSGSDTEADSETDYTSWFERIITSIEELPGKFETWITDCKTAIEELPSKLTEFFNGIKEAVLSIPDAIKNILTELFAPSEAFIQTKVEALTSKYPHMETFLALGDDLKAFFMGLGATAPIIMIDLGAATGSYYWGGSTIFLDLTWYEKYKGTMDNIVGGFIWLWLAWRVFQSLPGIIQGMTGTVGSITIAPDFAFNSPAPRLNSGTSANLLGTNEYHKPGGDKRHYTRHDGG